MGTPTCHVAADHPSIASTASAGSRRAGVRGKLASMTTKAEERKARAAKKEAAVQTYARTGNLTLAAASAGVSRDTVYHWRNNDSIFDEAMEEAEAVARDLLVEEIRRRGVDGVDEPVVHMGRFTFYQDPDTGELIRDSRGIPKPLTVKRYSDTLLLRLAEARMPEQFRANHRVDVHNENPAVIFAPVPQGQDEWLAQFGQGDIAEQARQRLGRQVPALPEPRTVIEGQAKEVVDLFDDPMFR